MAGPSVNAQDAAGQLGIAPSSLAFGPQKGNLGWGPEVPTLVYSDPKEGGNGQYCLNEDKGLVRWRWIPAKFEGNRYPITFSGNEYNELQVQIGASNGTRGDTEIAALLLTTTSGRRVAVRPVISSPIDKQLSNILIPSSLMFGTAQLPGLMPSSIYSMANTTWRFQVKNLSALSNIVSAVVWGRKFKDTQREQLGDIRRVAELMSCQWPYWIGPFNGSDPTMCGPEITLLPGRSVTLRFPAPSSADFLAKWILDDSSCTTGLEPLLVASIQEEDTGRTLVDFPAGISWRDFLACPTVTVTGMPSGGVIRAMSLGSPRGGWTHLMPRNSAWNITFKSNETVGTITLRPALAGWCINAKEPEGRHYSNDAVAKAERVQHARDLGSNPVKLFGDGR